MTDEERPRTDDGRRATRRATLRTTHADAAAVAAAIRPDNTDEMESQVEGETVLTTVERDTTGGLRSTVDDYVVNLQVADDLLDEQASEHSDTDTDTNHE